MEVKFVLAYRIMDKKKIKQDKKLITYQKEKLELSPYFNFINFEPCHNDNYNIIDKDFIVKIRGYEYVIVSARKMDEIVAFLLGIKCPIFYRNKRITSQYCMLFMIKKRYKKLGILSKLCYRDETINCYRVSHNPYSNNSVKIELWVRPFEYSTILNSGFNIPRPKSSKIESHFKLICSESSFSGFEITSEITRIDIVQKVNNTISKKNFIFKLELSFLENLRSFYIIDEDTEEWCIFGYYTYSIQNKKRKRIEAAVLSVWISEYPNMLSVAIKLLKLRSPKISILYTYTIGFMTKEALEIAKFLKSSDCFLSFEGEIDEKHINPSEILLPIL